jgi:hypothetical protein
MRRELRADHLLVENIRTLLSVRGIDDSALAVWCGHKPAWISKILSLERGVPVKELGKIADFFGLTVSQLFSPGISPLTERRKASDVARRPPNWDRPTSARGETAERASRRASLPASTEAENPSRLKRHASPPVWRRC